MPGSATVTVADLLELRAGGLSEEETWALLCQAAQTLQDLFLSKEMTRGKVVPVVSPQTLGINSKGRAVISIVDRIQGYHEPFLAPEYVSARDASNLDWEKMWVYSLGKTLLSALKAPLPIGCFCLLQFMTAEDPLSRASLMSLLNIISQHRETNLPVKPFSHLVMGLYREVFGTPPQCLFRGSTSGESADEHERPGKNPSSRTSSCGASSDASKSSGSTKKKPVERAPSRLYRAPSARGPIRRCVGPEFVVRAAEPWKVVHVGDAKGSQRRELTVVLLTGQKVRVSCEGQSVTCGRVWEVVVRVEEMEDDYLFGLACLVKGDFVFVPGEMKLHKVAPRGWKEGGAESRELRFFLYVRVKFFLPSVRGLKSGRTKHLMYLQLRRSLLEQQIKCEMEELVALGGLALQAEFGNFDEKEHGASPYFLLEHYLPDELIDSRSELESRLQQQHRSRLGLEAALAEELFMAQAQRLPEYGSHHYTALWVRKSLHIPMWLTVNPQGVYLYEKKKNVLERKIHEAFLWKNIHRLTCNEHWFRLSPRDVLGQKLPCYKLRMEGKKSYFLFRLASFHHKFFLKLRIELSPLDALSEEFGVRLKKKGKEGKEGFHLEEHPDKENESPEGRKRTGVRMGVTSLGAYVMEASVHSSSEGFAYEVQESMSSELVREWEQVSWQEERVLRKVRLRKDKYGCFGLEIVEGANGGLFVENVLRGRGEVGCVRRGDQVVSVNGVCLLSLNYSEALNVVKGAGDEMELLVSQSCGGEARQKPLEYEYLKNIRYETANEAENFEC